MAAWASKRNISDSGMRRLRPMTKLAKRPSRNILLMLSSCRCQRTASCAGVRYNLSSGRKSAFGGARRGLELAHDYSR
jgi:hypothetical protein